MYKRQHIEKELRPIYSIRVRLCIILCALLLHGIDITTIGIWIVYSAIGIEEIDLARNCVHTERLRRVEECSKGSWFMGNTRSSPKYGHVSI